MSFLFDQNVSHRILKQLDPYFDNSVTIKSMNLINSTDFEIWDICQKQHLNIISQDSDLNFIQSLRGYPPKIIWLRIGNQNTNYIAEVLNKHQSEIDQFLKNDSFGILEISGATTLK